MATLATGTKGKANFNGVDLDIKAWTWAEGGDDADVTDTGDAGVKVTSPVTYEYTATIEGIWDLDAQPTTKPAPGLFRGSAATLKLYISSEAYFSVAAVVTAVEFNSSVTDMIKYKATLKATAAPTYPGATAYSSSSSSSSS